ncbi:MAG: hypothetical protein QMB63_00050 [Clostridiaceae bacterium]
MAKEALEKIRGAEEEARALISDAQVKAKEILGAAERTSKDNDKNLLELAAKEAEELKENVRKKAEETVAPILEEGKAQVRSIEEIAGDAIEKAANSLLERIVGNNGNS